MRLPSVDLLITAARRTLGRFPLVMLAAVVAAVAGLLAVDAVDDPLPGRLLATATLGLPLFFALTLYAERGAWADTPRGVLQLVGVGALLVFFFAWPTWSEPVRVHRYFQTSAGLHLLAAFLPFVNRGELNGFWQYNRRLFERFLTAATFSLVLYLGLTIALLAVDNLLGIDIAEDHYLRLWIVIAFVFNTWFFLGGVPDDLAALDGRTDYPAGIKVFAQYILIPIVTVYVAILTAYLGKILVTRVWPSGWIGYLVSSVAITGILSLLLIHPAAERAENRWVTNYARWFYIALFPSIVMLLLAVWQRIGQYGVTERRYSLVVLSLWLAGIAAYYAATRSRNIKLIPTTLCAVVFLTLAGPWSAYAVSERSQVRRLAALLREHELLVDRRLRAAPGSVPFEDRKEMSAILRYLIETHGTDAIAGWFGEPLAAIDTIGTGTRPSPSGEADRRAELIMSHMGLAYVDRWQRGEERHFGYYAAHREPIRITGYDYAVDAGRLLAEAVRVDGAVVSYDSATATIRIRSAGGAALDVALQPALDSALAAERLSVVVGRDRPERKPLRIEARGDRIAAVLYLSSLGGRARDEGIELRNLAGELYLRVN